jgi:hypothetical protein
VVADGFAAGVFVVGESARSECGVQFRDSHVWCSGEGGDGWHIDVDAVGVGGWEEEGGERDLSAEGSAAAGVEEQREVPVSFGGSHDRDSHFLLEDFCSDGELGENAAVAHVGVGWAAFGAEVFKSGLRAGGDPEAAYGDAEGAWVAQCEGGEWGWYVVGESGDLDMDGDCCGAAQLVWCEFDVEFGRL